MTDQFKDIISLIGYSLEGIGVLILSMGFIVATFALLTRREKADRIAGYRRDLGKAMLLGLDFLVAGDIVRTVVVTNTLESIAGLGLVVLIRTVLVFTIHLEVENRWPWQKE